MVMMVAFLSATMKMKRMVETSPSPPKLPELREVVPESDIVNEDLVQPKNSENHSQRSVFIMAGLHALCGAAS